MTEDQGSSNAAISDPPVASVDVQDPLPEASWFWRRTFAFLLTSVICVQLYLLSRNIGNHDDAYWWTLLLLWFVILFYLVAPSAEQIIRIIQSARIIRGGGTMEKESTSETLQGRASTRTTASGPPTTPEPSPTPDTAPTGSEGASPTIPPEQPEDATENPSWPRG